MATRRSTKEKKKPKKGAKVKGNGYSNVSVGRTYPGTLPISPDRPGTANTGNY